MPEGIEPIVFMASYGDEQKRVELSQPFGGGNGWHITIDNYHRGVVYCRDGRWVYYDKWLETADIYEIVDIIERERPQARCR